jgi:hypothetical protein
MMCGDKGQEGLRIGTSRMKGSQLLTNVWSRLIFLVV